MIGTADTTQGSAPSGGEAQQPTQQQGQQQGQKQGQQQAQQQDSQNAGMVIESPFVDHLGAQLVSARDGASEVMLPLAERHLNTWDVAHGGVTMTLADIALAMAARSVAADGVGVVTVEMKVNFMQPGRGELRAYGRVLHRSTTMAYCEGEIRDSEGHFVAKALGTFKYMRKLAVGRDVTRQRLRSDPNAKPGPSDG